MYIEVLLIPEIKNEHGDYVREPWAKTYSFLIKTKMEFCPRLDDFINFGIVELKVNRVVHTLDGVPKVYVRDEDLFQSEEHVQARVQFYTDLVNSH